LWGGRISHFSTELASLLPQDGGESGTTFDITVPIETSAASSAALSEIELANVTGQASVEASSEVEDLTVLTHLHEPEILHALQLRYDCDLIYTATGPILLALNPFKVCKKEKERG
jgi:myosin heavy subunit